MDYNRNMYYSLINYLLGDTMSALTVILIVLAIILSIFGLFCVAGIIGIWIMEQQHKHDNETYFGLFENDKHNN